MNSLSDSEVIMAKFLCICQSSLDPQNYEAVESACEVLCKTRSDLTEDSLVKALKSISVKASKSTSDETIRDLLGIDGKSSLSLAVHHLTRVVEKVNEIFADSATVQRIINK